MCNSIRVARMAALMVISIAAASACGGEECASGATECLSDNLLRTCVPGQDGNVWLVSQCGTNFSCLSDPSRVIRSGDEDDAGVRVGPIGMVAPTQPACVGCDVGAHQCLSAALARYCVSGGIWQLDPCEVGETCSDSLGVCTVSDGKNTVQACKPGATACASDSVAKVCDADGTAWVEQPCAKNERCADDRCQPDPTAACDQGASCLDNKTAVHCVSRTQGYKLEQCTGDLYCEQGRCRGAVCAIGASCSGSNQVRQCVDGKAYKDTQCGTNEICMQDEDSAQCVPLQCNLGTSSCGDPRDSAVDKQKYFTACVLGEGSGVPEWVRGECVGAASCDPTRSNSSNPCSALCTPGAQRCASDPLAGVNDGIQTCTDQAEWGPVMGCNTGAESQLQCALAVSPDASELPKAVCAEPICAWVFGNPKVGAQGACDADKLRKCRDNGSLSAAISCESGVCRTVRSNVTADGRMPGACSASEECKTGEELCLDAGDLATPRYRTCDNGVWGVELKTCKNDALCYTGRDDKGLRHALCGAQCSPGSRRCNSDGALEVCDAGGHFNNASFCDVGVCTELGNHDAACVLECTPGTRQCTGSLGVMAADGYHSGGSQERVCGDDGRYAAAQACPDGQVCRSTSTSVVLGCVACVGSKAPGGNEDGTSDSRCDPQTDKNLQECADDNTWAQSRACSGSKTCVKPAAGSCGLCTNPMTGHNVVCSQKNLAADMQGATCDSLGFGTPSPWGGIDDCCADYHKGSGDTSSFAYCQ